jgi:hypothetical protein
LSEIETELQTIIKRSASSKASYRAKLSKVTCDLQESNKLVHVLEDELQDATTTRDDTQKRLDDTKHKREQEAERLLIRRMHSEILRFCVAEPDGIQEIMSHTNILSVHYCRPGKHNSNEELTLARKRLEDVQKLFVAAKQAEQSKVYEMRVQAQVMKRHAVSKYILFQQYKQI